MTVTKSLRRITFIDKNTSLSNLVTSATSAAITEDPKHIDIIRDEVVTPRIRRPCSDSKCIHTSPMMAVTDRVTSEGPSSHVQGTHTAPFHYTSPRHTYGCNSSKHVTSRESLSCPFVLSDCKAKKKSISLLRRCVVIYDNNRHTVKASLPENSSPSTKLTQQSDTMKKDTEQLRRSKTKIMRNNCKCCRTITPSLPSEQRDSIHRRFGILSNIPCKTTLYNGREKEDPKDFNSYTNPAADEGAPDPGAPDCVHIDNPYSHNSIEVSCASSSKGIPQDTNVDPPFCKTIPPQPVRAVQVAGEVHRCGSEGNPWDASYDECVETEVIVGSDDNGQKGDSSRLEVAEGVNSININNGRYVPVSPSFLFGRGNDKNEYEMNDISIKVKKCSKLSPLHLYNPRAPARNTSPRGDDKSPLQPLNIHQLSSSIVNGYTKTSSSLLSATNPIRSPSPDEKLGFSSGTGRKTVSKLTSPQIFESSSSKPTAHDIHIRTLCPRCSSHWPYAVISHNTCLAEGIQSDTHVSNMSKVALSLRPVGRSFPSLSNIILSHDLPANRDNSGSYRPSKDRVALKLYMTDRKHLKKCRKVLSESSNSIPVHNTSPSRGINQTKSPGRAIPLAVFTADSNLVNSILRANSKNVKKGSNITRSPYFRTHLPSPTGCDGQQSSGMTICGYSRTDRVVYDPIWCGQCYTSLVNNAGKDQIPSSVDVLQEGSDEYIRHAKLWPLPCIGFQLSQVGVSDVKKQQEQHMGKDVKGQMGGVDGCVHDKEMINDVLLFGSMAQATLATEFVWEQLCGEYQYIHGYSNRRDVEDNIPTISIPTKHKATTLARAPFTPSKSTISQLSHSFIVSPSTNSQNTGNRQSILLSSLPVTGKQLNSLREVSTRGANKQKTSVTNVMLHPTNTHSLAKRHGEIIKDHVQSSESVHLRHIKGDHRSPMGHEQTLGTSRCLTFAEEDDDEKKMVSFPLQPTLQASKTGTVVVSQEQRVSPSPNSTDDLLVNIGSCNTDELMPVKGKRCADRSLSRGIITKRNSKAQPINTLTFDTNENLIPTLSSPCAVSICSRSSNGLPIRDYSISEARGQNLFISSHQYIGRPNNYPLPISSHHCNSPLSLNSHSKHSAQSHQHSPPFQQSASSPSFVSRSHNFLTPARSAATPSCQVIATDTSVDDHQHQLKRGRSFNSQGVINEKEQQKAQQFYLHHQTPLQPGHSHEYTSGVSPVVPSRAASSLGSFFSPSYRCSQVPSQIPSATNVMSRSPMPSPLCGAGAVITPRTVASFQLSPTVSPSHFSAASNIINTNEKGPMSPNGPLYSVASQQQSSSGLTFLRRPKPTLLASTANTNPTTADHEIKTHFSPAIGLSQNRKIPIQNSASHKNDIKEITSNNHASVYALAECSPTGESCTSPHTISLGVPCRGARSSMAEAAAQYCEIDVWGRSVTPIAQSKAKMNSPNRQASNTSCFNHLLYY